MQRLNIKININPVYPYKFLQLSESKKEKC